jgi:hypothetical protein
MERKKFRTTRLSLPVVVFLDASRLKVQTSRMSVRSELFKTRKKLTLVNGFLRLQHFG